MLSGETALSVLIQITFSTFCLRLLSITFCVPTTLVLIDSSGTGVGPFQAIFQKAHAQDSSVINRGNPGPWIGYDRTKDRDVVPYAEIIE